MTTEINETRVGDVLLVRAGEDSVTLSWKHAGKDSKVVVYKGEKPEAIDRRQPAATVTDKSEVGILGLDPNTRYYFEVVSPGGKKTLIGERRVQLEGAVNFRDLGGYRTIDGRRVKWGLLFRSDNLGRLTDRDVNYLNRMGIRLVCDFRTPAEIKKLPDRYPAGNHGPFLHLPIRHGESDPANTFDRIKTGDIDWMTEEFMINGYIKNIEEFAHLWARFFKALADFSNYPLVFHCTGGKDRAGVAAALILLALGVPGETVIRDHGLSNMYIAEVLERIYGEIRRMGVDPERISSYFTAPRSAVVAVLDRLEKVYGSASNYLLDRAGVDASLLDRLKNDLLE